MSELLKLIKHYWLMVIVVPLICAGLCVFALTAIPPSYCAQATLSLSGEAGGIGSLAESAQSDIDVQSTKVGVKTDTTTKTITISATGSNPEACIAVANDVAQVTIDEAKQVYEKVTVLPKMAKEASDMSPSKMKYGIVALLVGLFLALCLILALDAKRGLIKSAQSLQELTGVPVVATLPAKDRGERLLANVRFAASQGSPNTVCIVPAGVDSTASEASFTLAKAIEAEGGVCRVTDIRHNGSRVAVGGASGAGFTEIQSCKSLASGMSGMYAAREADVVVVSARQWKDSLHNLEDTLQELALAQANVAGLVLVK